MSSTVKSEKVSVRLTPAEKKKLIMLCRKYKMTQTEWVQMCL